MLKLNSLQVVGLAISTEVGVEQACPVSRFLLVYMQFWGPRASPGSRVLLCCTWFGISCSEVTMCIFYWTIWLPDKLRDSHEHQVPIIINMWLSFFSYCATVPGCIRYLSGMSCFSYCSLVPGCIRYLSYIPSLLCFWAALAIALEIRAYAVCQPIITSLYFCLTCLVQLVFDIHVICFKQCTLNIKNGF